MQINSLRRVRARARSPTAQTTPSALRAAVSGCRGGYEWRPRQIARRGRATWFPRSGHLPLLDEPEGLRSAEEIADRCLSLSILVAHAYGWPAEQATALLDREQLWTSLTDAEQTFLGGDHNPQSISSAQASVESLWVLTWALGIGPPLRFDQHCPDNLVNLLPDLKRGDEMSVFRASARPRSATDLIHAADLAYVLHWAVVDADLHRRSLPGWIDRYVVENRRRALDWILMPGETWEDIALDT